MKNFFLNRQIRRIEREANDDFLQILSFGARCYPTRELHQLLIELDRKSQLYLHYRRLLFLLGATATLWIALCFVFQNLKFGIGIYFTLIMIPLSILAFTAGSIYINHRFRSARNAHRIEGIIVEELERRKKDASIF
ncbi:MAG: hypothetical protein KDD06_08770 [Phaeodactylibacter sp.]|nr:hypothetical protein [Phaeodactylibacter sp.]MCB9266590.1 hypothetical protein [Lewinellaceae bacterium]MCB9288663.1 hypothetical protein [Lewinellaceae bacterium]